MRRRYHALMVERRSEPEAHGGGPMQVLPLRHRQGVRYTLHLKGIAFAGQCRQWRFTIGRVFRWRHQPEGMQ